MHEMSLAEGIVQLVEDAARAEGGNKVKAVWLEIGQLSGTEPEAIRFCFDVVARDTLLDGARLEIIEAAGQGWCLGCGQSVALEQRYAPCPLCGSYQVEPTGGLETRVKEFLLE